MQRHERVIAVGIASLALAGGGFVLWSVTPASRDIGISLGVPEWPGPVRDTAGAPVEIMEGGARRYRWHDGHDASAAGIDVVHVVFRPDDPLWGMELAAWPPPAAELAPATATIAYGLTLEADGDGVADYVVGINNDAVESGHFRVWVEDVRTGARDEQVGPPYGFPVEFSHPDEQRDNDFLFPDTEPPAMVFTFLPADVPPDVVGDSVQFYVWTYLSADGEAVAWDYAPDTGWLSPP